MRHWKGIAGVAVLLGLTAAAWSQGPPPRSGPGGPGGGGGSFSPEMRQRMEQFRKFREQHKYSFQLREMVIALGEMERGTRCPLTPAQARKVSAVITRVKKQPKVTSEDAKQALKDLKAPLTTRQLTEIGKLTQKASERQGQRAGGPGGTPGARPGGPGGPGGMPGARPGGRQGGPGGVPGARPGGPGGPGGRQGGPGGPGGRGPAFDPAKMKDFNPLAEPKGDNQFMQRRYQRLADAISLVEKKAKQK